jgi:hypothetical protein
MYPRSLPTALAALILVLAGGILWFVLTRPASEGPPGSATSTPQMAGEKIHIEDSGEYHQIDAYYPSQTPLKASAGVSADASAVFAMKTFATKEVARFEDNNVAELRAEDIAVLSLGGERKYTLEVDYDFHESADTLSYVYHMYADTLGAHGNAYYRTFTFDKESGEELHIDDLFVSDTYVELLSQESRSALYDTLGDNASPDMLEAGTTPYSDNFQNFYLEGDALVLIFPPYQVGPWAIGTQEARIPRAALSSVLKAEYR